MSSTVKTVRLKWLVSFNALPNLYTMQGKKIFTFVSTLEGVQFNLTTAAVFLPHHVNIDLPRGPLKVIGLINGAPFSLALQFRRDRGRFFSVSNALRQAAKVQIGDSVDVCFHLIENNRVEIPEEGNTTPEFGDKAGNLFREFSRNRRELLFNYITAAKKIDQRMRKALELIQRASSDTASQDKKSKKNSQH